MRRALLFAIMMILLAACAEAGTSVVAVPTLAQLPTELPSATSAPTEPPTLTFTPSLTPTFTLTPAPTETPLPTQTPSDMPTETPNALATQVAELVATNDAAMQTLSAMGATQAVERTQRAAPIIQASGISASATDAPTQPPTAVPLTSTAIDQSVLSARIAEIDGVRSVSNVLSGPAALIITVDVADGYNATFMADTIRVAVQRTRPQDEAVLLLTLSDSRGDTQYAWDDVVMYWRITPLSSRTAFPTLPPPVFPTSPPAVYQAPVVPMQPLMSNPAAGFCPSMDAYCESLSCQQAYACLAAGVTRLDRDRDGVPCESVCGG